MVSVLERLLRKESMSTVTEEKTEIPVEKVEVEHPPIEVKEVEEDNITYALKGINAIRVAFDKEPIEKLPRGKIGDPNNCPIARALDGLATINGSYFRFSSPEVAAKAVEAMRDAGIPSFLVKNDDNRHRNSFHGGQGDITGDFVKEFDAGKYEDYIDTK